jgi:tetratricopeptide (TPR) repeat protein
LFYVQERYAEAEEAYSRALSLLTGLHGPESPELIDILLWLGESRFKSQQYDEAREPYQCAIAILEQQSDSNRLADALMKLAHFHYFVGEYSESEPFYARALELYQQSVGPEPISVASSAWQLARLYHLHPELNHEAEPLFKRAAAIYEKVYGPDHPDVAEGLYRLADHYRAANRQAEADPLYERAISILEAHPELSGLETNWMRSGYAEYLRETGREAEAKTLEEKWGEWSAFEEMLRTQVEKREATLGPEDPDFAESLYHLAGSCFFAQKYDEAEKHYERSLAIREKVLGPVHPDVAESLMGVARIHRLNHRFEDAKRLVERAVEIQGQIFGHEHPEYAHALEYQALIAEDLNRPDQTEKLYERALAIYQKSDGEESRDHVEGVFHLALFYARQERFADAERVVQHLLRLAEREIDVADLEKADYFELAAHVFEKVGSLRESEQLRARAELIFQESEKDETV